MSLKQDKRSPTGPALKQRTNPHWSNANVQKLLSEAEDAAIQRVWGNMPMVSRQQLLVVVIEHFIIRCRVTARGGGDDYMERHLPWWLVCQFRRTLEKAPYIPGQDLRAGIFGELQWDRKIPNFGVIVSRLDWDIWRWYSKDCQQYPIEWLYPGQTPNDISHEEYFEISYMNLRGTMSAWKKFPGNAYSGIFLSPRRIDALNSVHGANERTENLRIYV